MSAAMGATPAIEQSTSRRWGAILMGICVVLSLLAILYPAWVIQPFRAQGGRELLVALAFIRFSPAVTMATAVCGLFSTVTFWPRGWFKRTATVAALVVVVLSAAVARIDYFELMFHPNPNPQFVSVAQAAVDADDMVLVARSGAEAHAYPVRFMAYHHLVNDSVGGTPVVATY